VVKEMALDMNLHSTEHTQVLLHGVMATKKDASAFGNIY
jgi:hypothetical protein